MPTTEEWAWFKEKREGFEVLYHGKFVLIKGRTLIGVYDHQDDVHREAALRYGAAGCLIRFIGENKGPTVTPPWVIAPACAAPTSATI